MSSREKVLRAVSRKGPVPFPKHLRLCPDLVRHFRNLTGQNDLDAYFGLDLKWIYCNRPAEFDFASDLTQAEFDALFDFDIVARRAEEVRGAGLAVVSGYEPGTFEQAHAMYGMEGLFVQLMEDPGATSRFLTRIARNKARVAVGYARAGVDIVFIGDDMGSQRGLLINQQMWHEFFRPPLEIIIGAIRSTTPDIAIAYHSCGCIQPLIPALIEAGIDVLESVQPECNNIPEIVRAFGDRLSFWGCIGAQSTMARGTSQQVQDAICDLTALFPNLSGLIVAPAHTLEADTSPENVTAFIEALNQVNQRADAVLNEKARSAPEMPSIFLSNP